MNHQISHLAVIFAIVKFANHCMYCIRFCAHGGADQFPHPLLIDVSIISTGLYLYSGVMKSEAMGLFTVESVTTFTMRSSVIGEVLVVNEIAMIMQRHNSSRIASYVRIL